MSLANPIEPFLERQGVMILDGGLATELEARGCDLSDDLWSARLIMDEPEVIRDVHFEYLRSGADCVTSASYQATFEGFAKRGLAEEESQELLRRSVDLAREARDSFWADPHHRRNRLKPLVAASIGPYGAYLADGSEFRGDYDLEEDQLVAFHRRRWEILTSCGADLVACETLPSRLEGRALRRLMEQTPGVYAWFSFSCGSPLALNDGSSLRTVVAEFEAFSRIAAIGINCTSPRYISSLIDSLRHGSTKPVAVYPNSGEVWDSDHRTWVAGEPGSPSLLTCCEDWVRQGVRLIGGCCRTGPAEIKALRKKLLR